MKQFPKTEVYSLFSILAGLIGMAMQTWLLSTVDSKGLLVHGHFSAAISFLLLAAVVVLNALYLKKVKTDLTYDQMFPQSIVSAAGTFLAAAGFAITAIMPGSAGLLGLLVRVFGIISAVGLVFAGYCRFQGKQPNCLAYAAVAMFLIFRTLVLCQGWSAEVQIERYFFPLLACLSLLMAAYFRASLVLESKDCKRYLFFRQFALFCCMLSFVGGDSIFYLAGIMWIATDYCIPALPEKPVQ